MTTPSNPSQKLDDHTEDLMAAFADSHSGEEDVRNADALRQRIRELQEESFKEGYAAETLDEAYRKGIRGDA